MEKVLKFKTAKEAIEFEKENPKYRAILIAYGSDLIPACYDTTRNPPYNNALAEYWIKTGLIEV